MNQLQKAMSAVRTNPKSSKAWSDLGDALLEQKQIEKAKQSYQRALQLDPENKAAQQGIAMTLRPAQSVSKAEAPPSSKTPAAKKVSPPSSPPRSVKPEPQPKARRDSARKAVVKSDVEDKSSDKSKLAHEEDIADDSISFSRGRTSSVSAEKEKAIVFRDPPPPPQKPSSMRQSIGLFIIFLLAFLCVCAPLIFVAYLFIP